MRILIVLLRLARPAQWVKNIFVFTALIFSGLALEPASVAAALIAFAAFSMASSAIYFLNDYKDMEEDRLHPVKCNRPLASGRLPRAVGPIGALVLATTATLLAGWQLGPVSAGILLTYLAMNAAYSLGLKNLVIIDVLIIAAGFVLRILVGAAAIARIDLGAQERSLVRHPISAHKGRHGNLRLGEHHRREESQAAHVDPEQWTPGHRGRRDRRQQCSIPTRGDEPLGPPGRIGEAFPILRTHPLE